MAHNHKGFNGCEPAPFGLGGAPQVVRVDREKGYPLHPFDYTNNKYVPSASTIAGISGQPKSDIEPYWAAKVTRTIMSELLEMQPNIGINELVEQTKQRSLAYMRQARELGSLIHELTARIDSGDDITSLLHKQYAHVLPYVEHWMRFCEQYQPIWCAIERTCYTKPLIPGNSNTIIAGTVDRIFTVDTPLSIGSITIHPDEYVILDIKTKINKSINDITPDDAHKIQTQILSEATHIVLEEYQSLVELPDRIVATCIVYLCEDGYLTYWDTAHNSYWLHIAALGAELWQHRYHRKHTDYGIMQDWQSYEYQSIS